MSGMAPGGGSADFTKRLQDALTRAKGTTSAVAAGAKKSQTSLGAAGAAPAPPGDVVSARIAQALKQARGEPEQRTGGADRRVIRAGETLATVAAEYGVTSDSIWNDPLNAQIRNSRGGPSNLRPGDALFIRQAPQQSAGPVGQGDYQARQGDCMASIAVTSGFFWETLWDDSANSELKTVRKDPYILLPGDRVTIPEKRRKDESIAPEQRHRFKRKGCPEKLIVNFRVAGEPRANQPYSLNLDGDITEGTTDAAGRVELFIPPDARKGTIEFPETQDAYELELGHLDPISVLTGVQGRLRNLGFFGGSVDGHVSSELRDAISAFQQSQGLTPTGALDEAGRNKLLELHGS